LVWFNRSRITGYTDLNKPKKLGGVQEAAITSPLSAFGEITTSDVMPVAQGDFVYGVNDRVFTTGSFTGASVSNSNGMAEVSTGTDSAGCAEVRTRRGLKYRPGQGSLMRGTAIFDTPVANNKQLIGIGNDESGYYFGYDGTDFGVLHRETGQVEVRKVEITSGANSGDVTVTLNGNSIIVAVVGGNDTTQTAYQLSKADYSQVGDGWFADAVGSDVYFVSTRPKSGKTGTYSVSGATIAGTFSQINAGVDPTDTFIPSGSFNGDKLDGTGDSGMVLDPQKGNVYQVGYQYLGFGNAHFSVEDPDTGNFIKVHEIKNANSRTTPVLRNPNMSPKLLNLNTGNTTNVTLKGGSLGAFVEGKTANLDPQYSKAITFSSQNDNDFLDQPVLAMKVDAIFNNKVSYGEFDILSINCSNENTAKTLTVGLFEGVDIGGEVDYQYVNETNSVASTSTLVPGTSTITTVGATPFYTFAVAPQSSTTVDLSDMRFVITRNSNLVIAFRSSQNIAGDLSINWYEQQ